MLDLQLSYAPHAFRAERITWTRIVLLNISRAVNTIVTTIALELLPSSSSSPLPTPARYPYQTTTDTSSND